MMLSIVMNYVFTRLIDASNKPGARRTYLIIAIAINLGILVYNKYMNFFTENFQAIFGDSVVVTHIILPIGISFFTFQAISYVVDVYRGTAPVQKNIFFVGLYIAFFPQLIAGPIVRYRTIAEQIVNRSITLERFTTGVKRFCLGFAMKVLVANQMSIVADAAFDLAQTPAELSVGFAWLGVLAYTLQIFFDFAGYSAMAIGLGKMFGFDFPENFNFPYISKTVTEFWRRWHMSLSQWFRDYVYIPLGGSRVDKPRLVRNLFVVWLCTGFWHGANWTFIVWGMFYFVLLTFEKLSGLSKKKLKLAPETLYRIFTLLCVMLAWVLFRSDSIGEAINYLSSMFGLAGNVVVDGNFVRFGNDYLILFIIAIICSLPALTAFKKWLGKKLHAETLVNILCDLGAVALLVISVAALVMGGNNPFIYFNF